MRVYLNAYINKNLGDDLFLLIIAKRYSNVNFFVDSSANYLDCSNFKYVKNGLFSKLIKIISFNLINIETLYKNKVDCSIILGGSMFIESSILDTIRFSPIRNNNYFIIGSNFGPFRTKFYFNKCRKLFKHSFDTCFRDTYSKDLFNGSRVSPDLVFSLKYINEYSKYFDRKKILKTVFISVIDCNRPSLSMYCEQYEIEMVKVISKYIDDGYGVVLGSFCEAEGDGIAIERILSKISNNYLNKIDTCHYCGNVDLLFDIISSCSILVGTRYHACILGLLFGKKILPIAYSNKTINSLKYIGYTGKIYDLRSKTFNVDFKTDRLDSEKIDQLAKQSLNNFYGFDEYIREQG